MFEDNLSAFSTESRKVIFEHAKNLGIADVEGISIEQFYPTGYLSALYCKETLKSKKVFVIGLEGIETELTNMGIETVTIPKHMIENSRVSDEDFEKMQVDPSIDTVVSGYYPYWTYNVLCYSSLLIRGKWHFELFSSAF